MMVVVSLGAPQKNTKKKHAPNETPKDFSGFLQSLQIHPDTNSCHQHVAEVHDGSQTESWRGFNPS